MMKFYCKNLNYLLTEEVEDLVSWQIPWWSLELRVIILVGVQNISRGEENVNTHKYKPFRAKNIFSKNCVVYLNSFPRRVCMSLTYP